MRVVLPIAAALLASPALAAPATYTVDPTHTAVYFGASHFERTTVRGRFGKMDGRILYDPDSGTGSIDFTVDTDSVDTGNRSLDGVLRSAQFLDAQNFPVARL
ncbi:MAG TPA: polyisoprenoid-binding protein, partial [Cupriavidus sp.]|nr:polyisoprenoid-binding protein [Cupriavidus sp.]